MAAQHVVQRWRSTREANKSSTLAYQYGRTHQQILGSNSIRNLLDLLAPRVEQITMQGFHSATCAYIFQVKKLCHRYGQNLSGFTSPGRLPSVVVIHA